MLFRTEPSRVLAISQPTHAWISGQILRSWREALGETLMLAAEQHDIGWLDWERRRPSTLRPVAHISSARLARRRIRRCGDRVSSAPSAPGARMSLCSSRAMVE